MSVKKRFLLGAASGVGGTVFLSGLRLTLRAAGLVYETAPMQVVSRLEQALSIDSRPLAKRAMELVAHFGYGTSAGAAFGLLRRERAGTAADLSVGAALGLLLWGMGWAGWLPILGADRAPWNYKTPRVLLPIFDHAAFGVAWALLHRLLTRKAD